MAHRLVVSAEIAVFLIFLLGSGSALASVKCQCNNGSISYAMDADYDDDDAADSCNDACDMMGGGRAWNVDTDTSDNDGTTVIRNNPVRPRPEPRPR